MASKAVISNATLWDTVPMLPRDAMPREWIDEATSTAMCESFMHLHLGIDAAVAEEMVNEYMCNYFLTIVKHYEIMSDHFKDTKGYDSYASAADAFKAVVDQIKK